MIEGITEGREEMRIVPNVGRKALARVRRAQALNDDIDWTLDEEDEVRALGLWRPLARSYPEDLAVMHGYVLALSRRAGNAPTTALVAELRDAALRLVRLDGERRIAASFAGEALRRWALRSGSADDLLEALRYHEEAERRAQDDEHRGLSLHDQARVLSLLGRKEDANERTRRALELAPNSFHHRFDEEA